MSVSIEIEELLAYSDHERAKWMVWVTADPARLALPFQAGGRFPTLAGLLDHLFLVERRHLARLQGSTPPETSGVAPGDAKALFEYAALVRADLRRYVEDMDEPDAAVVLPITVASGSFSMTKRVLTAHILLHEIRHLGQVAFAARLAGHEPPGEHDYFYFRRLT